MITANASTRLSWLPWGCQYVGRERLQQPDGEPAEHGAGRRVEPAEHGAGEGEDHDRRHHVRLQAELRRHHHAGRPTPTRAARPQPMASIVPTPMPTSLAEPGLPAAPRRPRPSLVLLNITKIAGHHDHQHDDDADGLPAEDDRSPPLSRIGSVGNGDSAALGRKPQYQPAPLLMIDSSPSVTISSVSGDAPSTQRMMPRSMREPDEERDRHRRRARRRSTARRGPGSPRR